MQNTPNICIVNELQIEENRGGVQTVSYLLKDKFEALEIPVYSVHLEQKRNKYKNEYILPDTENIDSEENHKFLYNIIVNNKISIILFQGYLGELMKLCVDIRKTLPVKLIYTYHRDPEAGIKEYDDYKERIINNTKSHTIKLIKGIVLELKRPVFSHNCKERIKRGLAKYEMEYIDAFISLDEHYTNFIRSLYPKKYYHKFHTIINPIKTTCQNNNRKEKYVLFIARHTYQKRLDRLLYIWSETSNKFPEWKLIVVGNGDYHNQYIKIADEQNLKNIVFVGEQPANQYYRTCSIICMTSSHEGLPMTLIEAQSYGCVPIAYDSFSSARRIIINNYNGLLVKPFVKKKYRKALHTLMENEDLRNKFAQNGIEYIKQFDINIIIKEWISLIENL